MILDRLFGSASEGDTDTNRGIVWANFTRKYETWNFSPNETKEVVYDGIEKDVLYRFVDDESESRDTTSYNQELKCNYEVELFTEELDENWIEKRKEDKTMYLVAEGSWDGDNLRYSSPVLVIDKSTFETLKDEVDLAHNRSMTPSPRQLHQDLRERGI